jgi:hypothetical protein
MILEPEIGSTLSQICLAMRLGRAVSWIRNEGDFVTARRTHSFETWARMENSRRRCVGYRLVTTSRVCDVQPVTTSPDSY